jgi:oligopeptide transport system substrate-binding protein
MPWPRAAESRQEQVHCVTRLTAPANLDTIAPRVSTVCHIRMSTTTRVRGASKIMHGISTGGMVRAYWARTPLGRGLRVGVPLIGLLSLLLAACGPSAGGGGTAADQTFTWPLQQESTASDEVFDPAEIATAYDVQSAQMIFSGLVTLGADLNVRADAASKWDVSSDGKMYTFHLLPNLKFSDGTPLGAADFAYGIDRALDPHLCDGTDASGNPIKYGNSPYGGNCYNAGATYLNHILGATARINGAGGSDHSVVAQGDNPAAGISVIDSQTLVIRLDQPVAYFLEALTYPSSYPIEKSLVAKYPNGMWVYHLNEGGCSGPFKVASYDGGKTPADATTMTYVPNPDWGLAHHSPLTLTKVVRPYVGSPDDMYNAYRSGQYDYTDVPGHDYPYARGQDDFHEVASLQIQYFGFNFLTPPFDNQSIRQAFDLALNKQLLVDRVLNGGGIPTNHIVPQGQPGYSPDLTNPQPDGTQSLTGNQDAAAKLLAQALQACHGVEAGGGSSDPDYCPYIDAKHYTPLKEIDIYTAKKNQTRVQLTKSAAEQWNTVLGLNVQEKDVASFGTLYANIQAGVYDAWAIGWIADYPDPQDWISLQFRSNSPNNYSHLTSRDLDALMDKADLEQNVAARMKDYHDLEQQLVNLGPWLPYEQAKITWRQRTWVHGFGLDSVGTFPDTSWPQVYITSH